MIKVGRVPDYPWLQSIVRRKETEERRERQMRSNRRGRGPRDLTTLVVLENRDKEPKKGISNSKIMRPKL